MKLRRIKFTNTGNRIVLDYFPIYSDVESLYRKSVFPTVQGLDGAQRTDRREP